MVFVFTKCKTKEDASALSKIIVQNKLGYSVDYFEVFSVTIEENQANETKEYMLLINTIEQKIELINNLILEHFDSEVPLVASLDIRRINRAYKEKVSNYFF